MATLTQRTLLLAAVAALAADPAAAAAPARGLAFRQAVYADAADLPLKAPEGVACDDGGTLVVADTGNSRLLTFTWRDGTLIQGRQIRLQQIVYPFRVQIDGKGDVLVLDRKGRRIVRVDERGAYAGIVEAKGATLTVSAFRAGPGGDLVVLDVVVGKVLVVGSDSAVKRELPLPKGALGITDVAVDAGGRLYVVDAPSATVFAAEPAATAFQPLSKSLKEEISFPTYLAPDNRGRLYLTDQHGHAIVTLGVDGSFLGRELALGQATGALQYPAQLCITSLGDVVVADRANNRVQIFTSTR
jgi:DNA-binding beta-propeller fold protein YncE